MSLCVYFFNRFGKILPGLSKMLNIINEIKKYTSHKLQKNHAVIKNIIEGDWMIEYILLNITIKSHSLPFNNYFFSTFLQNYKKLYNELKPHFFVGLVELLYNKLASYLLFTLNESTFNNEIKNQLSFEQLNFVINLSETLLIGNLPKFESVKKN